MKTNLKIERMLGITITMPQKCYFECGEEITKKYGNKDSKSLVFHSLDGDHDNWDPTNKVPAHKDCHNKYHSTGRRCSEETRQKIREAKLGVKNPGQSQRMMGDNNPMKDPVVAAKVSKALTGRKYGSERSKKAWKKRLELYGPSGGDYSKGWKLRREIYGPSGVKDPKARGRAISEAMKNGGAKKAVTTRRERYGPSGVRDPEANNKAVSEGRRKGKNSWRTRVELYGPTGRKPKVIG